MPFPWDFPQLCTGDWGLPTYSGHRLRVLTFSRAVFTFRELRKGLQTLLGPGRLADTGELHRYLAG